MRRREGEKREKRERKKKKIENKTIDKEKKKN